MIKTVLGIQARYGKFDVEIFDYFQPMSLIKRNDVSRCHEPVCQYLICIIIQKGRGIDERGKDGGWTQGREGEEGEKKLEKDGDASVKNRLKPGSLQLI